MTAGDFFALVAVMFGLVSIAGILAGAYKRNLDFKERKLELEVQAATARASTPNARNDRLEERVRVLERIATDRSPELASQIEALRDTRADKMLLDEGSAA